MSADVESAEFELPEPYDPRDREPERRECIDCGAIEGWADGLIHENGCRTVAAEEREMDRLDAEDRAREQAEANRPERPRVKASEQREMDRMTGGAR